MQSLHDLRSLQKPDSKVEDILAAVIIICTKSFGFNNFIEIVIL